MRKSFPGRRKSITLAVMLAGTSMTAAAQESAQEAEVEEIVVTGSLIRGTPVDANLPVEVYSAEEMRERGDPSALEFVKSLSASGPTTGEAYYWGGSGNTGNVGFNLRGIGSDKTLTLFNGRRHAQNTSIIPQSALARTEILKDGAAVTYGADATGGVVNFITRDAYDGFEITSNYTHIDDSDGDWSVSALGGFGNGTTDVLFAAEWDHRSELSLADRSFANTPYSVNPAPWSGLTNLAGWMPRTGMPEVPGNTANTEWGTPLGLASDFTQESCEAVGGVYVNSYTCNYNYAPFYNLIEQNEIYRLYGQVRSTVSDNMEFYMNAAYGRVYTPTAYGSPSQPVVRGPARGTGATHQLYVPVNNPYVDEFMQRSGWSDSPYAGLTQGFTPITYRAFAHGGNETFAENGNHSTPNENDNRYWHLSTGFNGEFDNDIGYDLGLTYNQSVIRSKAPDIVGYRLQESLQGFGGPNCNAPDLDPSRYGTQNPEMAGVGDCMWWNPFASNFSGQPEFGLPNPSHIAGTENSQELAEWLFNQRESETTNWNVTADFVLSGMSPLELPGGGVAWAAGLQWRQTDIRDSVPDPLYNGSTPCMWPASEGQTPRTTDDPQYTGCTPDEPGPFFFFGTELPESNMQRQFSYFGELQLPILDTLVMTAAVRNESFTGDLDATVYKVSGKWDATNNLSFRGSYGTNYQAPPVTLNPGEINNGVNSYTIAGGAWKGAQTVTDTGIEPETATVWSSGAIWQSRGFTPDHDFQFIVDYFSIETEDELGLLASANDVADSVFSISPTGGAVPTDGTALADCSHPLINRVIFNGGACIQGESTATDFAEIRTTYGNGPGQHTTGFDIQTNYSFPAFAGNVRLGVTATKIQKFEFTATELDGFELDPGDERLGTLNFATIANAASEWRATFNANYRQDIHNIRMTLNYVMGVDDERYFNDDGSVVGPAALTPRGAQPGTDQPFEPTYWGVKGDDWVTGDLHYNIELPVATLTASIRNITDEDPPASRQEAGFDPRIGNAYGRTFQIGFRKEF